MTRVRQPIVWSAELLWTSLQQTLKLCADQVKICFFIDGLDELEGNQEALVKMLHSIVHTSPNFKACVSSRPWKVFEQAFASTPKLKLQDLTRNDIRQFVNDTLQNASEVHRILQKDAAASESLTDQITTNADGIFLWASLAVRTLVKYTTPTDTAPNLLQKLDALPTDLDNLFRHLLFKSKSTVQLEEQSRILQIIQAREVVYDSSNVVTLYQMALANDGESFEFTAEPTRPPNAQTLYRCQSIKSHVLDRCAGLLRVHQSTQKEARARLGGMDDTNPKTLARSRISYLHRTVRDFFLHSGDFDNIVKHTKRNFDPHICLLQSLVLQLRFPLEPPERHRRLDEWWPDIILALTHARYARPESKHTQVLLLNHFKNTLDWYWVAKPSDPLDNWARNAFATYEQRMKYRIPYHYPFLSLASKFGLRYYLESELDTGNYPYKGGIPLLSYAVHFLANRRHSVYPLSSIDMVKMLLEKGQNPNLMYKTSTNTDETPWLLTLKYIREADRRGWIEGNESEDGIKRWATVVELLIRHGADPNALILEDQWDPAAIASDVLTIISKKHPTPSIKRLLDLLIHHGATLRAVGE